MLLYFVIDMCDNLKLQMQKYNIVIKKNNKIRNNLIKRINIREEL